MYSKYRYMFLLYLYCISLLYLYKTDKCTNILNILANKVIHAQVH